MPNVPAEVVRKIKTVVIPKIMNDCSNAYLLGCAIGFFCAAFHIACLCCRKCNKDLLDKKEIGKPTPPQSKIIKE